MATGVTPSLAEIRAGAAAHDREFAQRRWPGVGDLAARWGVSRSTVRDIPRADLPYLEFGQGLHLKRRRYHPDDVATFEARRFPGRAQ